MEKNTDVAFNAVDDNIMESVDDTTDDDGEEFSIGKVIRDEKEKVTTLNKKQRKTVQEGIREIAIQQRAERECVQGTTAPMKMTTVMMLIGITALTSLAQTWKNTIVADIGSDVEHEISDQVINFVISFS